MLTKEQYDAMANLHQEWPWLEIEDIYSVMLLCVFKAREDYLKLTDFLVSGAMPRDIGLNRWNSL